MISGFSGKTEGLYNSGHRNFDFSYGDFIVHLKLNSSKAVHLHKLRNILFPKKSGFLSSNFFFI